MGSEIVVYTALAGDIDPPRTDILCLGGYDKFREPRRNAKIYKILPWLFFEAEWSVWVDANIFPRIIPEAWIVLAAGHDVTVFEHYHRDCIYAEAEECKRLNKDDHALIDAQVAHYRAEGVPEHGGLAMCGVIIRRHTERVRQLCERWWAEICRWTCRDQISFPYVFGKEAHYLPKLDLWHNEFWEIRSHQHER